MPLNTIHCWSKENTYFDYSFRADSHSSKTRFVYVRKTVRQKDVFDMSLKFRLEKGIRRYEREGFIDGISTRIQVALQQHHYNLTIDREAPRQNMRTLTVFAVPKDSHWDVALIIANAYLEECASRQMQPFA